MKNSIWKSFLAVILFLTVFLAAPSMKAQAEETATTVTIGKTDYDKLTMIINTNHNTIVYISTDKKTWHEVEGTKNAEGTQCEMDISWIPNTADKTIYFKGNKATTIVPVSLPARDNSIKVSYHKADEEFTFTNCDTAEYFQWRKSTDYTWTTVSMTPGTSSHDEFMATVQNFLCKGAKIIIRIPQKAGTDTANTGERPSKEVTVTLTKRANAPSVHVNASKLTLNTTTKMEYLDMSKGGSGVWTECEKNMSVADIAPETLFEKGGKTVTVQIRTAKTLTKGYSKTAFVTIPGQTKAPEVNGASGISYYTEESTTSNKLCIQFPNASKTEPYSYCIVKPGAVYDVSKVTWKQVTDTKIKKLSSKTAPEGSMIYVRKQGKNENVNKGIALVLSSQVKEFEVDYNSTPSITK